MALLGIATCTSHNDNNKSVIQVTHIQDASVNRAILQLCFFLVRQHWGGSRYRHSADNFKAS
jgi:hypothetical protein